jgi:hypothetical protein
MYFIAFTLGVVLPIASIIAVGVLSDVTFASMRRAQFLPGGVAEGGTDPAFLFFAWSAMTFLAILGIAAAVWIIVSTAERLGIDSGRSYLRGMFLMAFAVGALVPVAAVIAAGATTSSLPRQWHSDMRIWFQIIMWCGVIAVCLTGLFSAAWLVKSSVVKLASQSRSGSSTEIYEPHYINPTEAVR